MAAGGAAHANAGTGLSPLGCVLGRSVQAHSFAYLTAAALALAERPRRFRFQAGADGRLHLMHDGAGVATVHSAVLESSSLAADLTRLADLRVQPLALAQFLASVPAQVLERAGAILMDELRKAR